MCSRILMYCAHREKQPQEFSYIFPEIGLYEIHKIILSTNFEMSNWHSSPIKNELTFWVQLFGIAKPYKVIGPLIKIILKEDIHSNQH